MRKIFLLFAMSTLLISYATAQENMMSLVKSQHFQFIATGINSSLISEYPQFSSMNMDGYSIEVTKKYLDCKLPFVGRVYRNGMNEHHIEVYASKYTYEYKVVKRRKTTDIIVKMSALSNDGGDKLNFTLVIGESGRAVLTVVSNNRETVTYYGTVYPYKLYKK